MKRKFTILVSLIGLLLAACNKDDNLVIDPDNPMVGTWVRSKDGSETNTVTYTRASQLKSDDFGMILQADGKIVRRQIAGWCATPPWAYENYEGKWNLVDGAFHTTFRYQWIPEDVKQSWKLVSVDRNTLVLQYQ